MLPRLTDEQKNRPYQAKPTTYRPNKPAPSTEAANFLPTKTNKSLAYKPQRQNKPQNYGPTKARQVKKSPATAPSPALYVS